MKQVDSLSDYRARRDFSRTPEPPGRLRARRKKRSFFIQKHAASHLHYDFRLELEGVLKSWAVPKGPCLDPAVNRLAVLVEDHPLDYGSFEGRIPKGQYGAGTVLLWDRGSWIPEGDPLEAYRKGHLLFTLEGEKLKGRWSLVRFKRADDEGTKKELWLLRKAKDGFSTALSTEDVLTARPESVLSGSVPLPRSPEPELATLVDEAPQGDDWIHEIKFDGYRFLARIEQGAATLLSRNGLDWTERLPRLAGELVTLPARRALLDGELVSLREDGTSNFEALKDALGRKAEATLIYYVFDLLHLDGTDLRGTPLLRRKELLRSLLDSGAHPRVRYADHVVGNGAIFFRESCGLGLEGIVSKRKDSPYRPGRGLDWVKVKCLKRQEFVIGGFTEPRTSTQGLGALLLGVNEGPGLAYAGRVGSGFSAAELQDLRRRLEAIEGPTSPFRAPLSRLESKGVHWVEPRLVCEVSYANWTRDRRLRHPVFQGLREDKPAGEVVRETPMAPPAARPPLRLTHPGRVLYPSAGITKSDLAKFYQDIASWILPQVQGRLLSLVRCPQGEGKPCFYQKHRMEAMPRALRVMTFQESDGPATGLFIEDEAGLIALVQLGVLEIHPWGSRVTDLERPDRCTFDLDPGPDVDWKSVIQLARELRDYLQGLGLESFVKTTGGKGLHVVVPLSADAEWPAVKAFSKSVAEDLARRSPDRITAKMAKASRGGRVFIDYLRNSRGATAVAAYSTRARPLAPVSVPLTWEELSSSLRADEYTVQNLRRRLDRLGEDPWKRLSDVKQTLPGTRSP